MNAVDMTKKQKRQIEEAVQIAIDSVLPGQCQDLLEEVAEFAVARLSMPAPGFSNPYSPEHWNLTNQIQLEASNPEAAAALEKKALSERG